MPGRTFFVRARLEARDAASATIRRVQSSFRRFTDFVGKRMVITLESVGRAVTAIFRKIAEAATLAGTTEALKRNLAAQGIAFDAYMHKLREVSDSTISNAKLIRSSSKALLLGIPATEIATLLEVARASSIATGESVAKAFEDITVGIGRASPMIIDNLGIILKLGPAYKKMAEELKKNTENLTAAEQKQAILNEVLRVGKERVEQFGDAQSEATLRILQGQAAFENFSNAAGNFASNVGLFLAAFLTQITAGFVSFARILALVVAEFANLATRLPFIGAAFDGIAGATGRFESRLGVAASKMFRLADSMYSAGSAGFAAQLGLDKTSAAAIAAADAYSKAAAAAAGLASSTDDAKTATEELGTALGIVTSLELEGKVDEITEALEKSRAELGANSEEFVRLEQLAAEKLESLRARIQSIQDGLGDLTPVTATAAAGLDEFGNSAAAAAEKTDTLNTSLERNAQNLGRQAAAATTSAAATGGAQVGQTGFSFASGRVTFYQGRWVRVFPDGRMELY